MDIFQLIGDFLHLIAVLMLLLKILANKNVIGLSYKTQELFLVVFLTRYSDMILEMHWGSVYFNVMRILFVAVTAYTIYVMRFKRPYKMVTERSSRVMITNLMPSRIGPSTSPRQSWPSSSIRPSHFTASSGHSRSGWRPEPSCPNFT